MEVRFESLFGLVNFLWSLWPFYNEGKSIFKRPGELFLVKVPIFQGQGAAFQDFDITFYLSRFL